VPVSGEKLCLEAWGPAHSTTRNIFGGSQTDWDSSSSQELMCDGFGLDNPLAPRFSPQFACAMIAAVALYAAEPPVRKFTDICDKAGLAADVAAGDWAGAVGGEICDRLSDVFATGVGIAAATAASEGGPAAVAVGVSTWKGLSAFLKVGCGGLFDGAAHDLGVWLETRHEARVAADISTRGLCLRERRAFGMLSWSAAACS
jgi:hypothetical protein